MTTTAAIAVVGLAIAAFAAYLTVRRHSDSSRLHRTLADGHSTSSTITNVERVAHYSRVLLDVHDDHYREPARRPDVHGP